MIYQIKKNRLINEINKELSGYYCHTNINNDVRDFYYNIKGFAKIAVYHNRKKIMLADKINKYCLEDDIYFNIVRKFTNCENYTV